MEPKVRGVKLLKPAPHPISISVYVGEEGVCLFIDSYFTAGFPPGHNPYLGEPPLCWLNCGYTGEHFTSAEAGKV